MSRPSTEPPLPAGLPFAANGDGVRVRIRVAPRARSRRIEGLRQEADGHVRLKLAVTEPAFDGRANAAVLEMLAHEWELPKSALAITAGRANRQKTVSITGDPQSLMARLLTWSRAQVWVAET